MTDTEKHKKVFVYTVSKTSSGFVVNCDEKSLVTPAGITLALPTKALAEDVAEEWRAQKEPPKPETMPMTQLAVTAIDIVPTKRDDVIASIVAYAESDLLCHHAEEPAELVEEQRNVWLPWLEWTKDKYGTALHVVQGIMPVIQPKASLEAFRQVVGTYDNYYLVGLQQVVGVTGSLLLGLALVGNAATVDQVFKAAELDSLFQMKKWGEDPVTVERHKSVHKELGDYAKWFRLLQG